MRQLCLPRMSHYHCHDCHDHEDENNNVMFGLLIWVLIIIGIIFFAYKYEGSPKRTPTEDEKSDTVPELESGEPQAKSRVSIRVI